MTTSNRAVIVVHPFFHSKEEMVSSLMLTLRVERLGNEGRGGYVSSLDELVCSEVV